MHHAAGGLRNRMRLKKRRFVATRAYTTLTIQIMGGSVRRQLFLPVSDNYYFRSGFPLLLCSSLLRPKVTRGDRQLLARRRLAAGFFSPAARI